MTLDLDDLKSGLTTLFTDISVGDSSLYSASAVATGWGDAYDIYASQGEDGLGNKIITKDKGKFIAVLTTAFSSAEHSGSLSLDARPDLDNAVNQYWQGGILDVSNTPPGCMIPLLNVVIGTPGDMNFDITATGDIGGAVDKVSNKYEEKSKKVMTLFTFIHAGTPPYIDYYTSNLM